MRLETDYKINLNLLCRDNTSLVLNVKLNLTNSFDSGKNMRNNTSINEDENRFKENLIYIAKIHDKQTYFVLVSYCY